MLKAKIEFKFSGDQYIKSMSENVSNAINRGALLVQNETKTLLNQSGKSMPAKGKLNTAASVAGRKRTPADKGMTAAEMKAKRLYFYGEPLHRWVEASKVGDPPHKQTGNLQRSINVELSSPRKKKIESKIGPAQQLVYARVHEMGSDKMPARPYLTPAFLSNEKKILKLIESAIMETKP